MRQEMHLFCLIRLLDVSACARNQSLDLTLVFEYIDQDLTTFMNCAEHGLSREKIKVTPVDECIPLVFKHNTIFLFLLFTITIIVHYFNIFPIAFRRKTLAFRCDNFFAPSHGGLRPFEYAAARRATISSAPVNPVI